MKIFGKAAPAVDISEILATAIGPAGFRDLQDSEVEGASKALAKALGKTAPVALIRRLVVSSDGQRPLLKLHGCWPTWGEPRPMAFPFKEGLEVLASPSNPENEVARRREQEQKWADAEKARNDAHLAASQAEMETRRQLSQARQDNHADWWALMAGWQRFAARLALAVEPHNAGLAEALRATVAQTLAGGEDDFPRAPWWKGMGFESLPEERRRGLGYAATVENAQLLVGEIPAHRLHSFELMHGRLPEVTVLGIAEQWKGIRKAEAHQPKPNSVAETKPHVEAPPSGPRLRMRDLP